MIAAGERQIRKPIFSIRPPLSRTRANVLKLFLKIIMFITQIDNTFFGVLFMDVFRALGNNNRRSMLKILIKRRTHISALAKELNIAVPVALKHAKILEEIGFVERTKFGNTHVLQVRKAALQKIKHLWDLFEKPLTVEVSRGTTMLDALQKVSGLKFEKRKDGAYITSVDGKDGFYIYEVEGKLVEKPANEFKIEKSAEVELKRLMPVIGKKILIHVKEEG